MADFARKHMLEIGGIVLAVGLVFVVLSFTRDTSYALGAYKSAVPKDWNQWVMVLSPVLSVVGGWYFGEQVVLRRRYHRLLSAEKKSDFQRNRRELEELARRLPPAYEQAVEDKATDFKSLR